MPKPSKLASGRLQLQPSVVLLVNLVLLVLLVLLVPLVLVILKLPERLRQIQP
jgi:hypothetical protein